MQCAERKKKGRLWRKPEILSLLQSTRILYFFYEGANIILTNSFVKKTQKTPAQEIKLAKLRRADYLSRKGKLK